MAIFVLEQHKNDEYENQISQTFLSHLPDVPNVPASEYFGLNEPVSYENDWRTLIDQWENAEAANNELFRESLRQEGTSVGDSLAQNVADLLNSDFARPDITPERLELVEKTLEDNGIEYTPNNWDAINALIDQIEADDEIAQRERIPVTREDVKSGLSSALNTAIDVANVANALYNPSSTIVPVVADAVGDVLDTSANNWNEAQRTASALGLVEGTPEYDNFVNNYGQAQREQAEYNALVESQNVDKADVARERAEREQALRDRTQAEYEALIESQNTDRSDVDEYRAEQAERERLANIYGAPGYDNTGAVNDAWTAMLSGNALAETESPAYNADGTPNATLQAILDGQYGTYFFNGQDLEKLRETNPEYYEMIKAQNAEAALANYNTKDGRFQGIEIPPEILPYIASSVGTASGMETTYFMEGDGTIRTTTNGKVEYINTTPEKMEAAVKALIAANKPLQDMINAGIISEVDVMLHFFKAIGAGSGKPKGSGSGYGSGYGGYGGRGYSGGGGGGGSRSSGYSGSSAKSQTEQRINNIMKNWTF